MSASPTTKTAAVKPPRLTGTTVADLLRTRTSALVQHRDSGEWSVVPDLQQALEDGDVLDEHVVLRDEGREWIGDHVDTAREAAEDAGTTTAVRTINAAAAKLANAELLDEWREEQQAELDAAEAAAARPTSPAGRHAAPVAFDLIPRPRQASEARHSA